MTDCFATVQTARGSRVPAPQPQNGQSRPYHSHRWRRGAARRQPSHFAGR